ncbi:flagellar filament capping protein FliD [Thiopseudomonas acetoxidans]|uniref:Flagellar hook-associated protein 2 n=1 Tax=Thiopseudomonas acetoxidans TaxID=3041622 RepID=A0ABT7SM48_9GAMM|nr:flagellar filament capping protein FliD [Thiopseudomonas sp. CY1220]MDM7857257.1 flagellar filament capping protein FliD [Thiopseudomonas sp. CY1220]NLC09866.1 flagellar filament capping protein FliD [Gammaproteobacteria bacterium]
MAGIPGIGSGLDIKGLVNSMVQAETAPKAAQLQRQEKTTEAKFSALGKLQSALSNFQSSMKELNKMTLFDNMKAASSNGSALSATASKTAAAGTYSVEVTSLATSSKVATKAVATDFKASGAGSLEVKLGSDGEVTTVNIADGSSLTDVRDALNEQLKDKGITANIVNNPASGTSQIVLSSKETGAGKDIVMTGTLAGVIGEADFNVDGTKDIKAEDGGAGYLQQAANAKFSIDGLALESATNTVANVIPDVEFTLKGKTEEGKPLTVTVGEDRSGVKDQLKKFVESYNEFMTVAKELTAVTKVGDDKAPVVGGLVGDSTVRSLLNGVRAELGNVMPGAQGLRVLADLGITTQQDGKLKIDDKKLDAALEQNFDKVGQFIAGDNGLMSRLDSKIDAYTGKTGIIGERQKSLDLARSDIKKQTERLNERSIQIEARLLKQFNAMDALVGQLNSTSSSLMQSLASLPGMSRKD